MNKNDDGTRTVHLTSEMHEFMIENCDANMRQGLAVLQSGAFSRETCEKVVTLIEKFRKLREALREAE